MVEADDDDDDNDDDDDDDDDDDVNADGWCFFLFRELTITVYSLLYKCT